MVLGASFGVQCSRVTMTCIAIGGASHVLFELWPTTSLNSTPWNRLVKKSKFWSFNNVVKICKQCLLLQLLGDLVLQPLRRSFAPRPSPDSLGPKWKFSTATGHSRSERMLITVHEMNTRLTAVKLASRLRLLRPPSPPLHNIWAMMIVRRMRKNYQNCSVLYCVTQLCTFMCTLIWAVLTYVLF